jgi:phosphatidylglycerophosphate synthase
MPWSIYSSGEARAILLWQRGKDTVLTPLTSLLASLRVSPLAVSVAGVLLAFSGALLAVVFDALWYLVLGIGLHLLCDALDGALARAQSGEVHRGGVLTDVCADFLVVTIVSGFLAYVYPFDAVLPLVFSSLYGVLLALLLVSSAMGRPMPWVIRPRILLYLVLTLDALFGMGWTMRVLFVLTCIVGLEVLLALRHVAIDDRKR